MEVTSYGKSKYVLIFRDTATGHGEAHLLAEKSDAALLLINICRMLERQTNQKIKVLRDNGGEFLNHVLTKFMQEKIIPGERSLPYHHFQNRMVEKFNCTLGDMSRTIFGDSGLDKRFWGFAYMWACQILNRIPNKSSSKIKPFKAMFQQKPKSNHLKLFGDLAWVLVAPEKRKKFDQRSVAARVVCQLDISKGWLFWIPQSDMLYVAIFLQMPLCLL